MLGFRVRGWGKGFDSELVDDLTASGIFVEEVGDRSLSGH